MNSVGTPLRRKDLRPDAFELFVDGLASTYIDLWRSTSAEFPALETRFTYDQQRDRERDIDKLIHESVTGAEQRTSTYEQARRFERLRARVRGAVAMAAGPDDSPKARELLDSFSDAGDAFARCARDFDPAVHSEDIHQALRNFWIFNSLQVYLGKDVGLSSSSFAYSMLYPYTDNYLDDPGVSAVRKRAFVSNLRRRLSGEAMEGPTPHEQTISRLIGLIEGDYPRAGSHELYGSLLAIHAAQEQSLLLHSPHVSADRILDVSIAKGGTSVLADGYLVTGSLSPEEAAFIFGYGAFLQLVDDLQDLEEDLARGHRTIFAVASSPLDLEAMTNRLMRFLMRILDEGARLFPPSTKALTTLVRRSCVGLVLESVARHAALFTPSYGADLEAYSPLSFTYLRSLKLRMNKERGMLRRVALGFSSS